MAGMRFTFDDLVAVMARLRGPQGCPWDREQTPASLLPYLLEEAHEVIDAVGRGDQAALREELGDLLLQVVFHAEMARSAGGFTAGDVVDGLVRKLIERHPHVFGDTRPGTAGDVLAQWHELKQREAPHRGTFDGIPATLPALARAQKVLGLAVQHGARGTRANGPAAAARDLERHLRRAASLGASGARARGRRATTGQAGQVIGELLLAAVALADAAGVDAETALRDAAGRLVARSGRSAPHRRTR
jgi:uncharacterized protein YabN with tetrapyrrole methylase and pyrophosphatase domain